MDPVDSFIVLLAASVPTEGGSGTIGGIIFFMVLAISFSFLCSILEAALLSTPPSYIETQASQGSRPSLLMQKLKQNVEEPITAILTLNTFAHTFGAGFAGAQAVAVFGSASAGLVTFVLTFLILVFSEIIPKTLGAVYWKQLFTFTAYLCQILVWIFKPIVWMSKVMTRLITSEDKEPTVTRSELEMMAQISATEGTIEEKESRILKNLLQLNKVHVYDVMTPRTVMLAFQQDTTIDEVMNGKKVIPYSRIPIFDENVDDIVGFVLRHDILKKAASDQDSVPLRELKRPMHSIPETITVTKALDEFMQRQDHIFHVFDEYGGTAGIITMEDAVESLLGVEITDESDLVADLRQLAEQRYQRQKNLLEESNLTRTTLNGKVHPILNSNGKNGPTDALPVRRPETQPAE